MKKLSIILCFMLIGCCPFRHMTKAEIREVNRGATHFLKVMKATNVNSGSVRNIVHDLKQTMARVTTIEDGLVKEGRAKRITDESTDV